MVLYVKYNWKKYVAGLARAREALKILLHFSRST